MRNMIDCPFDTINFKLIGHDNEYLVDSINNINMVNLDASFCIDFTVSKLEKVINESLSGIFEVLTVDFISNTSEATVQWILPNTPQMVDIVKNMIVSKKIPKYGLEVTTIYGTIVGDIEEEKQEDAS